MAKTRNKKVFVGLSGGVDSSVAALLLKAKPDEFERLTGRPAPKGFRGYDVTGIHLRCWNIDGCDEDEAEDARRAANKIDIPFYVFDMEKEYRKRVVDYMIRGYERGITPNPDVMCNKEIKFGLFLEKALGMGADYVATGHYVKLEEENGAYNLYTADDKNKDQSYFLWTLTQDKLKHCIFPIGEYKKSEVREIARRANLPNADKKDSQGICFIGDVSIKDFLKEYLPGKRGNVYSTSGKILGTHEGAQFFTIGQRHGLGISGNKPYFIASKDTEKNIIVLADKDDDSIYREKVNITDVNLISEKTLPAEVFVRLRYRQPAQRARASLTGDGIEIHFDKPQEFVAPGQSAVLYKKNGMII